MPLSTQDDPKNPKPKETNVADSKASTEEEFPNNPHGNNDPDIDDGYEDLDPTKVVGTYAMQPDPNADRPAPLPVVPKGVKKAPADDAKDAKAKVE